MRDDEQQTRAAVTFLTTQRKMGKKFFITDIVLCELVWVLRKVYRKKPPEILVALTSIVEGFDFKFESDQRIRNAMAAYQSGKADFPDYMIGLKCFDEGCETVATFDKALLKEKGFVGV